MPAEITQSCLSKQLHRNIKSALPLAGSALFHVYFIRKKVIHIEVKIPKEIRAHRETIFFGLSARQFICAVLAVGLAAGSYLGLGGIIGKEAASWLCLLAAAPVAIAGFFHYNGMTLEQFLWAFIKSEILCAGPRRFDSVNLHEEVFASIMEDTLE